jgi:hypothetical protein
MLLGGVAPPENWLNPRKFADRHDHAVARLNGTNLKAQPPTSSFPRRRESILLMVKIRMDPRLRRGDE